MADECVPDVLRLTFDSSVNSQHFFMIVLTPNLAKRAGAV
jgi:hypothetical protein